MLPILNLLEECIIILDNETRKVVFSNDNAFRLDEIRGSDLKFNICADITDESDLSIRYEAAIFQPIERWVLKRMYISEEDLLEHINSQTSNLSLAEIVDARNCGQIAPVKQIYKIQRTDSS